MSKHVARNTQGAHPWRATVRTVFALVLALAAMAPLIYGAVAQSDPEGATGAAAGALAIAGAITRVMALPTVDAFLVRFLPWLSAAGRDDAEPVEPSAPMVRDEPRPEVPGAVYLEGTTEYSVSPEHGPTVADPGRYEK